MRGTPVDTPLRRKMVERGFLTVRQLAQAANVPYQNLAQVHKRLRRSLTKWQYNVAATLDCLPEDIFPFQPKPEPPVKQEVYDIAFSLRTYSVNPEECLARKQAMMLVSRALLKVSPREERILRMRFWHDLTLDEIGAVMGKGGYSVNRERVRQIEAKALRLLKHPKRSRELGQAEDALIEPWLLQYPWRSGNRKHPPTAPGTPPPWLVRFAESAPPIEVAPPPQPEPPPRPAPWTPKPAPPPPPPPPPPSRYPKVSPLRFFDLSMCTRPPRLTADRYVREAYLFVTTLPPTGKGTLVPCPLCRQGELDWFRQDWPRRLHCICTTEKCFNAVILAPVPQEELACD